MKTRDIKRHDCPFCWETGLDLEELKHHLFSCTEFDKVLSTKRYLEQVKREEKK